MIEHDFRPPRAKFRLMNEKEEEPHNTIPHPTLTPPPAEAVLAAEKAQAVVEQADALETKIRMIIDVVKKRAEEIEGEGLRILTEFSAQRLAFQANADKFLEQTSTWQAGLREVFNKQEKQ